MCTNSSFLTLVLILKVIFLFVLPVFVVVSSIIKKYDRFNNKLLVLEIIILLLFIVLKISNNSCITNSNINYIKRSKSTIDYNGTGFSKDPNILEKIITNEIYKGPTGKNVYYFSNNKLPLSDKKIVCEDKELYMKNYGNTLTAASILVSSVLQKNIDPIEVMHVAFKYNIFDCEKGVKTEDLLNALANEYHLRVSYVDESMLVNYVNQGGVVLAKVIVKPNFNNFACDESNIIIYNVNSQNELYILNPNNRDSDYICPSNSAGYGQIIKANSNNKAWSFNSINSVSYEYLSLERN